MKEEKNIIEQLEAKLPAAFGRSAIENLLPGIISSKTLANLDSAGTGPPYYKLGRKVFYEKESFLKWFMQRVTKVMV